MFSNHEFDVSFGRAAGISEVLAAEYAALDDYEDACSEAFEIDAFEADGG